MDILKDKRYKDYNRLSRYGNFPCYYNTLDRKYLTGTTANLKDTSSYTIYIVKPNDSYDSIALRFYNNPTYYWVICDFNRIQNPFVKPAEGSRIKIPTLSNITYQD